MTIDIPEATHKKLKAIAAVQGKSMREIVIELIDERLRGTNNDNLEKEKVRRAIEEILEDYGPALEKLAKL